jgi:hypothetical protein
MINLHQVPRSIACLAGTQQNMAIGYFQLGDIPDETPPFFEDQYAILELQDSMMFYLNRMK